jgi:hypothetical protein
MYTRTQEDKKDCSGCSYQGTRHSTPSMSHLAWKVANNVRDDGLLNSELKRNGNKSAMLVDNLPRSGAKKLQSSTLCTFNKRTQGFIRGHQIDFVENKSLLSPNFSFERVDEGLDTESDTESDGEN